VGLERVFFEIRTTRPHPDSDLRGNSMAGINIGKMIVGGVVAGVVINVGQTIVHLFLFADQSAALTESLGLGEPTGGQIGVYWLLGFIIGMVMIKIYVAIRPRFGPGPGTAIKAAVVTWTLGELVPTLFYTSSGLFDLTDNLVFTISTLVLLIAGAIAGAAMYSEDGDAAAAAAPGA